MKRINIITIDNQSGLTRDAHILSKILSNAGFKVSIFEVGKKTVGHKLHRLKTYSESFSSHFFSNKPPYDINLFIQEIVPDWFPSARLNCLIPNQEWFRESSLAYLSQLDWVLCKTREAQNIFNKLGCKTEFISFTSLERWDKDISKNYSSFFHLAGSNPYQKGTKTLIEIWLRHPEWPKLYLRQKKLPFHFPATNIEYLTEFLDDPTLCQYQNVHGIHLCPSQSEGFGHYIVEAMSTQALVLTTNAPPMNELIAPDRGILTNYSHSEPQQLGTKFYVNSQELEQKIEEVIDMDYHHKKQLGENAREWYLNNHHFFCQKIIEVMSNL